MKSRIIAIGLLVSCAAFAQNSTAPKSESLKVVAERVAKSLLAADWNAFRKDAAWSIVYQEDYRAYDDYFSEKSLKGMKSMLGEADYKVISYSTAVKNSANPDKGAMLHFKGFCKQVKVSRGYAGQSWEWPTITDLRGISELDSSAIMSPCALATIASNLDWGVEFINESGRWKAKRLVLSGH